ncbi:uncharacterized protein LOC100141704 [Tribolium castaneum]|uniref:Lipoprotein n=1 Tax=Tribolium castaneum TaxID=7070 RepID=D6WN90_TRICA|nr:PREDICTED: uncharacterized protein LOC100141704 [Tribolium castaneum]EFA03080.2 hypothetical protein TcasGA2_TC010954 [Tribolium castaneum]|eukprot:XP_001813100.2 PREDICTED: uncharacterized protein LOC100141704 [Tribolium castaneum]
MKLMVIANLFVIYFCQCEETKMDEEDQQMLKQSILLFGAPRILNDLPGPEFTKKDVDKIPLIIDFRNDNPGKYSFKYYTKLNQLAYVERYEAGELQEIGNQVILKVKGQYAERFERKNGGYYIRTIGYTADEDGYKPFLIDLSTYSTESVYNETVIYRGGGPKGEAKGISSTVLITLTGGNAVG